MDTDPLPLNTFILRFWQSAETTPPIWLGELKHVQTGARTAIISAEGLLRFLRQWVTLPADDAAAEPASLEEGGQPILHDNPMEENCS